MAGQRIKERGMNQSSKKKQKKIYQTSEEMTDQSDKDNQAKSKKLCFDNGLTNMQSFPVFLKNKVQLEMVSEKVFFFFWK